MKKSQLKALIREVIKEMKTYRVYADIPGGAGWEKYVKANSPEEARKKAEVGQYYRADTVEEVPADQERNRNRYQEFLAKLEATEKELQAKHDKEMAELRKKHEILKRAYKG